MSDRKWYTVWILGFLALLAVLNAFNSVLLWLQNGSTFSFTPYLIGQYIGPLQVELYFWVSITVGFVLLGCTAFVAFRKSDDKIIETITAQSRVLERFFEAFRTSLKSHEHLETHIDEVSFKSQERLEAQFNDLQGALPHKDAIVKNVRKHLEKHSDVIKTELSGALAQQDAIVRRLGRLSSAIKKLKGDFADMKTGLDALEAALLFPEPKLTVESSPKEINGIGPRTTKELEAMGITNVGEFLSTDPAVIGDETYLTREKAEQLQGTVQLLMIPYIDEIDIELLEKVGVTNRKELAAQDPFDLNIRLSEVTKAFIADHKLQESEKPTLEEVLSWIRVAKL